MRQPLRALCAATALGLSLTALAGCSDDPEPNIGGGDPSSEAAPPESSEPATTEPATDGTEATEPTEPTGPTEPTEPPEQETPQDFIARWLAADVEMQNTGETDAFLALSKDCESCTNIAGLVETYYEAGGTIEWEGASLVRVTNYDKSRNAYLAVYDSGPTKYRKKRGGPLQRLDGGRMEYVFELEKRGASWLVLRADELVR